VLTPQTRLADVRGGRGLGVAPGTIEFSFDGGPTAQIDLTGVEDVEDVLAAVTAAIRQYETDNGVTILGPGGVSVSGGGISIDVVPGPPDPQLSFADVTSGTTAQDLGLSQAAFEATAAVGADLDPRLTRLTPLSAVSGLTLPMDGIRIKFTLGSNTSVREVDLSSAQTIDDVRALIETAAPGVRVRVGADGRGIDIVNEISGPSMSIEEVSGAPNTATELGVRSLDLTTALSAFNDGRGVSINHGAVDPVTGLPDPARDIDFRITLGSGQAFDVDLRPADMVSVETVLARINEAFSDALLQPPIEAGSPPLAAGDFLATLTDGANGITFTQSPGQAAGGGIDVKGRNNSGAAEDLGLLTGSYDAASASFIAQDRATVRVDSIFTALIELRESLRSDSSSGITLAGERLEAAVNRIGETRALVGVHASRVARAITRLEDSQLNDEKLRSQWQDLDYAEAATRFTMLQTQLQAALTAGSQINSLSLLDFIR
jgi:flagellin-like hook-associated protein FlgL